MHLRHLCLAFYVGTDIIVPTMEPRTIQPNAELTVVQAMEQVLAWDVAPKQSELLRPAEVTRWLADKQRLVDALAAYHATLPTEQGKEP